MRKFFLRFPGMKAFAVSVCGLSLCSCSSLELIDPAKIPVPGNYISDGFYVHAIFTSVLTLPSRAKVMVNGVQVGLLENMQLDPDSAQVTVTLHMNSDAKIPQGSTLHLRQATLLGDTFLAVEQPVSPESGIWEDGFVIDSAHTTPSIQLEHVLQGLSDLVTSGTLQDLNTLQMQIQKELPDDPKEISRLRNILVTTVGDLAQNTTMLDGLLHKSLSVLTALADQRFHIENLALTGPERYKEFSLAIVEVQKFFSSVGPLMENIGDILIPHARDINEMVGAGKIFVRELSRLDLTFPYRLERLKEFFAYYLLPYWMGGEENIEMERYVPDGDRQGATGQVADNIMNSLRVLGVLR